MKYLKFNTKEEREEFNRNEAIKRGCGGVTLFWFGEFCCEKDHEFYLEIPLTYIESLDEDIKSKLIDERPIMDSNLKG